MKDGLKIYACSGLNLNPQGVGTAPSEFNYWLDNTQTIHNTVAVNCLLIEINLLFAKLRTDNMTEEEVQYALDLIDLYVVCLQAAKQYHGAGLERAGNVIAGMVEADAFHFLSMDNDERDDNLDALIAEADELVASEEVFPYVESAFREWFKTNVEDKDYDGLTPEQQRAAEKYYATAGVGATAGSGDPATDLVDSGGYYLYLYMQPEVAKAAGSVVKWKRNKQKEVYDYVVKGSGQVYGGKEGINKLIAIGIRKRYDKSPEEVIQTLTNTKGQGIGTVSLAAFLAVCAKIAAVCMAIAAVLQVVLGFIGTIITAVYADPVDAGDGTPGLTEDDLNDLRNYYESQQRTGLSFDEDSKKYLKYGFIGFGILFLIKMLNR